MCAQQWWSRACSSYAAVCQRTRTRKRYGCDRRATKLVDLCPHRDLHRLADAFLMHVCANMTNIQRVEGIMRRF